MMCFPFWDLQVVKINHEVVEEMKRNFWNLLIIQLLLKVSFGYIIVIDFMKSQRKFAAGFPRWKEKKGKEKQWKKCHSCNFHNRETMSPGRCWREWALNSWTNDLSVSMSSSSLVSKKQAIQTDYHLNYFGYQCLSAVGCADREACMLWDHVYSTWRQWFTRVTEFPSTQKARSSRFFFWKSSHKFMWVLKVHNIWITVFLMWLLSDHDVITCLNIFNKDSLLPETHNCERKQLKKLINFF